MSIIRFPSENFTKREKKKQNKNGIQFSLPTESHWGSVKYVSYRYTWLRFLITCETDLLVLFLKNFEEKECTPRTNLFIKNTFSLQ